MTKSNWILTALLILSVAGWILSLRYCKEKVPCLEQPVETGDTISVDTTTTITPPDTNFVTILVTPKPSAPRPSDIQDFGTPGPDFDTLWGNGDSIIYMYVDPDFDEVLKYASYFEDTVKIDSIAEVYYRAQIRGYMDGIKLGYRILKPFTVNNITVTKVGIPETDDRPSVSFYGGLDAGGSMTSFGHLKPEVSVLAGRMIYSAGFNIPDQAITVGFKVRMFAIKFKRKK